MNANLIDKAPPAADSAFISDLAALRGLESILAQEEEHAEDLVDLLEDLPKD
jgi:hypothetical protein